MTNCDDATLPITYATAAAGQIQKNAFKIATTVPMLPALRGFTAYSSKR